MCPILYKEVEAEEKEVGCLSIYAISKKDNIRYHSYEEIILEWMNESFIQSLAQK